MEETCSITLVLRIDQLNYSLVGRVVLFVAAHIHERTFWKRCTRAFTECLAATSTHHSPWYAVPADDKENAGLIVSQIVMDAFDDLKAVLINKRNIL